MSESVWVGEAIYCSTWRLYRVDLPHDQALSDARLDTPQATDTPHTPVCGRFVMAAITLLVVMPNNTLAWSPSV